MCLFFVTGVDTLQPKLPWHFHRGLCLTPTRRHSVHLFGSLDMVFFCHVLWKEILEFLATKSWPGQLKFHDGYGSNAPLLATTTEIPEARGRVADWFDSPGLFASMAWTASLRIALYIEMPPMVDIGFQTIALPHSGLLWDITPRREWLGSAAGGLAAPHMVNSETKTSQGGAAPSPGHFPPGTCPPHWITRGSSTISLSGQLWLLEEILRGLLLSPSLHSSMPIWRPSPTSLTLDQQAPTMGPSMTRSSGHPAICTSLSASCSPSEGRCGLYCRSYSWNFQWGYDMWDFVGIGCMAAHIYLGMQWQW